jgi:hypothetical protein
MLGHRLGLGMADQVDGRTSNLRNCGSGNVIDLTSLLVDGDAVSQQILGDMYSFGHGDAIYVKHGCDLLTFSAV